ncbi:MAG TPA: YjcZ family sporulation protein [Ureibacillus sp.]|nr:YjcZ family sporulation protein [Ureibacillus sp.]
MGYGNVGGSYDCNNVGGSYDNNNKDFVLIVVLFILLIIVGASFMKY